MTGRRRDLARSRDLQPDWEPRRGWNVCRSRVPRRVRDSHVGRDVRRHIAAAIESVGRRSLAWGLSAVAFAVLGVAFLEDVPGPEREALNAALDPVFRIPPFSWTGLGSAMRLWPVAGVFGLISRGARAMRPPSRGMRYIVWVALLSAVSWTVERGIGAYLLSCYGSLQVPAGWSLLGPAFLLLGVALSLERLGLVTRSIGAIAAVTVSLAAAGRLVLLGADPVVGMASLIASASVFCLWSAVLSAPQLAEVR